MEEEDTGVDGAGWLTAAAAVEGTAFAGAEEEGKSRSSSDLPASFSLPSPPDSIEDAEGTWDIRALEGAARTVP